MESTTQKKTAREIQNDVNSALSAYFGNLQRCWDYGKNELDGDRLTRHVDDLIDKLQAAGRD